MEIGIFITIFLKFQNFFTQYVNIAHILGNIGLKWSFFHPIFTDFYPF